MGAMWFVGLHSELLAHVMVDKNVATNLNVLFPKFQVDDSISFECFTNSMLRLKSNALKIIV